MKSKNTGLKIIIVITLMISVAGLSLGFANYASNLKIESDLKYELTIENQPTWLVSFDYSPAHVSAVWHGNDGTLGRNYDEKKITAIYEPAEGEMEPSCTDEYDGIFNPYGTDISCQDVEASNATISGLTVSDIKVSFKNVASAVYYILPVGNFGLIDAYLKSVTFDGTPTCTAANGATISQDTLDAICNNIDYVFNYNGYDYSDTTTNISTNNFLESGTYLMASLLVGLKTSDEALSNIAVDKIDISLPDITLEYSSIN